MESSRRSCGGVRTAGYVVVLCVDARWLGEGRGEGNTSRRPGGRGRDQLCARPRPPVCAAEHRFCLDARALCACSPPPAASRSPPPFPAAQHPDTCLDPPQKLYDDVDWTKFIVIEEEGEEEDY